MANGYTVMLATVVIIGGGFLVHFLFYAVTAPQDVRLGFAAKLPNSNSPWFYRYMVVGSWAAFTFTGAHSLFSWLTTGVTLVMSTIVTLLSLGLLAHIERCAYLLQAYRTACIARKEFIKSLHQAASLEETLVHLQQKALRATTLFERAAYIEMVELASAIAARPH
jgi:sensor histidine kinase YesM